MTSIRLILICAAAAVLAAPSAATAAAKGCKLPKGAKLEEQNKSVVVYRTGGGETLVVRACSFKTGRTTPIDSTVGLRLAGALVANVMFDDPGPAGSDSGTGVEVTDAKSGKTLFANFFDSDDDNVDIEITDLELTKTGKS